MTDENGKQCVVTSRPVLRGSEDGLSEVDPTELADGCLCFVRENASLYVYLREGRSMKPHPEVVKPSRGPGQWERTNCRLVG
jgi:hypothetical protein